jgi:hypothetical protein
MWVPRPSGPPRCANTTAALDHHLRQQEETVTDTIPQPPADGIPPQIRDWMITCARAMEAGDSLDWQLEQRVAAVEEVLAARWPRRLLLARRLGRDLRASIVPFTDEPGFLQRRAQATATSWLSEREEQRSRRKDGSDEHLHRAR